jgi:hypothetical protein
MNPGMTRTMANARRRARRRPAARRRGRIHHRHLRARHRFARHIDRGGRRGSTLLALVQEVQQRFENDADVVRVVRRMVNSGAVVLTGNFAGARF